MIHLLGKVAPEKWPQLAKIFESLMTPDMNEKNRVNVIKALEKVPADKLFHDKFATTAGQLIPQNMHGSQSARVIEALGNVSAEKIERVYGQIQRLMQEPRGKIKLVRWEAASSLISQLRHADTDVLAQAFTTALIEYVNAAPGEVNDDTLLTHINTAGDRVRRATPIQLQELARNTQSTHKREVHQSVAKSVERLAETYKDQLPQGDIFELIQAMLISAFPADISTKLEDAKAAAIKLVGPDAIENLLKIPPHARATGNDADTALNVAARALWAGKSPETEKAIQEVARLHGQKGDLQEAEKLLEKLKNNPNDKEEITKIGYEGLLRLIYAAITDENWGDSKDIPDRWKSLMTRMARAQNEYQPGSQACAAGTFNALLEPLSDVHRDVRIIMSFRVLMQELSAEADDSEFERRIQVALSYLGPNAAEDPDYKVDIQAAREARKAQQDKDAQALEALRTELSKLKDISDAEFEQKAQAFLETLSEVSKKDGMALIEMQKRGRHAARFQSELGGLRGLSLEDLKAKALALLESYPETYRKDFENRLLRPAVQARALALAQAEGIPEESTPAVPSGAAPECSIDVDTPDLTRVSAHRLGLGSNPETDQQN